MACADKQVRLWDLGSNQVIYHINDFKNKLIPFQVTVVGQHDAPALSCHWITSPAYSCLLTSGWDKTLRFWDMRQLPTQSSMATIQLPERVYCTDVMYPLGVVALANRHVKLYKLDGNPQEVQDAESQLKYQSRCVSIFKNKDTGQPAGYALGSIEGTYLVV
jgi:mRNA export factor